MAGVPLQGRHLFPVLSSVPSVLSLSAIENPLLPRHLAASSNLAEVDRENFLPISPGHWQVKHLGDHMELERYTLQFNRTHLLFIPPLDPNSPSGTVVQVSLRGELGERNISSLFSVERASITRTIETLLVGHVNALYELPKCVVIEGVVSGYTLIGLRKPWNYGRGKHFCLGDIPLRPAEHKWIFRFEIAG